ncbi:MAG: hypothetical protein EBZ59_11460 [Planctomycetia bacterium]|nr:hypothetical protein [Planctomycetia bacterium]
MDGIEIRPHRPRVEEVLAPYAGTWGFDPDLLRGIIHWHHEVFAYRGRHERVIEGCRWAEHSTPGPEPARARLVDPLPGGRASFTVLARAVASFSGSTSA